MAWQDFLLAFGTAAWRSGGNEPGERAGISQAGRYSILNVHFLRIIKPRGPEKFPSLLHILRARVYQERREHRSIMLTARSVTRLNSQHSFTSSIDRLPSQPVLLKGTQINHIRRRFFHLYSVVPLEQNTITAQTMQNHQQ